MITGADLLCRVLEDHGITCVFGVPGVQTIRLHEALRRSGIRVVLTTHELGASFMANGYYRASGRIAPLVTIPGPGFTYALTGLAEALHDSAAVLHITGRAPGPDHREYFQALDQRAIAAPLVKGTHRIDEVSEIPTVVAESLDLALRGEPGPVLLELAPEAMAAAAVPAARRRPSPRTEIDAEIVARAAELLASARRPLLIAGQGCAGAAEPLRELAELLSAPVLTTTSGRGVLAEDHPLSLGFDFARSDSETANQLFRAADVILAIGCRLGASGTAGFRLDIPSERFIRVDADPVALRGRYPAELGIVSTAETFLAKITPALQRRRHLNSGWTRAQVGTWKAQFKAGVDEPEPDVNGARPSTAAAFFSALRSALPRDGIVVADSGLHQTLLRRHFDVLVARGLIVPSDFQSMGFGIAAAIGAGIAAPGRPIVAVVGDGGFAMSGLELLTAVREKVPMTVVVFADGVLNRVRLDQLRRYGRSADVDLLNPDFAAFARAVGAGHVRCEGDADSVLRRAIGSGGVTLIEVPVRDSVAVHVSRVKGLAKGGVRRALGSKGVDVLRRGLRWVRGIGDESAAYPSPDRPPAGGARPSVVASPTRMHGSSGAGLPPVLLGDATWWGTLAAARDLGSRGVPVTLASDARMAPARWSHHIAHTVLCPSNVQPTRMLEWLLDFGRRSPGYAIYPTSDEAAWLMAANRETLGRYFRLYSPPVDALLCLLDKQRLGAAARAAGLHAPDAWCPANAEEVVRVSQEAIFPLYVKPRTQIFASLHGKGQRVDQPDELLPVWRSWCGKARFPAEVLRQIPGAALPLLQASLDHTDRIFTVDGFVDDTGDLSCMRGCVKVLQWPRGSGPGICFEDAPVPVEIEEGLLRLFRRTGFHGVFDAEFIEDGERHLLIDVNPRFYNHMAFEVKRGLPLPWLAYLGAVGDHAALAAAVASAKRAVGESEIYVHRFPLRLMLGFQALAGTMSAEERHRWHGWVASHEGHITDPAGDTGDPWPAVAQLPFELTRFAEHPRAYLRRLTSADPS